MAAGNTYVAIAEQTLGSVATSVTFSSIPSTYTDLVIVYDGTTASNAYPSIRFNGDTGTNYSATVIRGNGSAAGSTRFSSANEMDIAMGSPLSTSQNNIIIQVMNYSNTTTYKTVLARTNNASVETGAGVGLWRSTSAINSITIKTNSPNFAIGSTFSLYGIKAA
jgi:hypothetical protein